MLSKLPDDYFVLNDIMVKNGDGFAQIDHIVVSNYGIFVIETKNYKGWIYGSEHSEYWSQNIYRYKYVLYNPLKQNKKHIVVLAKILDIPVELFTPIVVFLPKVNLSIKIQDTNDKNYILYTYQLNDFIKSQAQDKIFSNDEVKTIFETIIKLNIVSPELRQQHIQNVENIAFNKQQLLRQNKCPKCGGDLITKHGKYGVFLSCENFPKCRFSKPINYDD